MTAQPRVAVLDYGIGNLRSAQKALQRVGADAHLTADPDLIDTAAGVVLPGVGAFGPCMDALHETGLAEPARKAAASGRPFLGICVGMQMLFESSEESPDEPGLGILPGVVEWLPAEVKRPQMQWNRLAARRDDPVVADGDWMYFVHSLSCRPSDPDTTVTEVDYGGPVVAAIRSGSLLATQFHPEKSGAAGLAMLRRWADSL